MRALGETEQRLYALPVWQEMPFFSDLWTEKLTLISLDHVPDEIYEHVRPHFTDEELANLTLVITTINAWNRFGIGFRDEPGHHKPAKHQ
jgi:alkylhydroperoxidase family enzyme